MKKRIHKMMKNKLMFFIISIIFLLLTFGTGYLTYIILLLANIANDIRFLAITIILFIWFILYHQSTNTLLKNKKKKYIVLIIIMIIYSVALLIGSVMAHKMYSKFSKISTNKDVYSTSLVTLNTNNIDNIKNISTNDKIGILEDENSMEGNKIPTEVIKKESLSNEIIAYNDYLSLINDLNDKKIEYIFLPTNYEILFSGIEDIKLDNFKSIYTYSKEEQIKTSNETLTKPFTILLMGVDSTKEDIKNSSVNGDSLMIITFNPETLNSTILSIPRDTYTNITCFAGERKNKITHAAWYGESCMQKTIEKLLDIKIDYYVKINFKGLVNLVDSLNGIEVDVPIKFCEQDSNRNFKNKICLEKGVQTLNGEQALALSRHRKTINDFVRGQNQQLVVKALMNKILASKNLDTVNKILDSLGNSVETNITTNQIFSLYDVAIKIADESKTKTTFNMQRLYISGYDQYIFDYSNLYNAGMKLNLYNFIPYQGSLDDVKKAMKVNLDIEQEEIIKSFNFDINNEYKETIIGKKTYPAINAPKLLPNFVGKDKSVAVTYANNNGIKINIEPAKGSTIGQIISQSPYANIDTEYMDKNKGITIKVVTETNQIIDNEE